MMNDMEQLKMAFQGDFNNLDTEIQVQLKALIQNDFKVVEQVKNQEMSAEEQRWYLLSDKEK